MKVRGGILHGIMVLAVVVLVLGFGIGVTHADVKTVNVSCNNGESIGKALEAGEEGKPLVVVVRGICSENVVIDRDDVTLQGNSSGDGITGSDPTKDTILVDGARRVVIENLTVTGGRNGISFFHGAGGTVDSATIQDTGSHGIMLEGGSATVINSTISGNMQAGIILVNGGNGRIGITNSDQYAGNTISNNGGDGIHLQYGASAFIGGNTISGNGTDPSTLIDRSGIALFHASAAVVGNNMITGNRGSGIIARSSSLRIGEGRFRLSPVNTITGNGISTSEGGVFAFLGTQIDIRNATISGNTGEGVTAVGSSLRIRDSMISGNAGQGVQAFLGTTFDIRNTTVTGNIGRAGAPGFGVVLITRSVGRMRGNIIENNSSDGIRLVTGSGLALETPPVSVTGNGGFGLQCIGGESSFTGNTSGFPGTPGGNINFADCTGF